MTRPPIMPLAKAGLVDMTRAVRQMPALFALVAAAALVSAFLDALLPAALPFELYVLVALATSALLTACVGVALHRFVILSEPNGALGLVARWRIVFDFAFVVFAVQFFMMLPGLIALSIWPVKDVPSVVAALNAVCILATLVVLVRHLLVFPAIAIDADDKSLSAASRGIGTLILPIILASIVAMLAIGLMASLVGLPVLLASPDATMAARALKALIETLVTAATVAIVSRAWLWREGQPLP